LTSPSGTESNGLCACISLRQIDATRLFSVKQPDISKMLNGDFRQFSVERLLRFLVALGEDVEIVVKPQKGKGVTSSASLSPTASETEVTDAQTTCPAQ